MRVKRIILCGTKMWGYEKQIGLEQVQLIHIKWILGWEYYILYCFGGNRKDELWLESESDEGEKSWNDKWENRWCKRDIIREHQGKKKRKWEMKSKEFYERDGCSVEEVKERERERERGGGGDIEEIKICKGRS